MKEILSRKTILLSQQHSHLSPGRQRETLLRLADRETVPVPRAARRAVVPPVAPAKRVLTCERRERAGELVAAAGIEPATRGL